MRYFAYRILIDDVRDARKARKWCTEQFGKLGLINKKIKKGWIISSVYDVENNSWYNKLGGKANPCAFHFKDECDAMAFKLRWL